MATLTSQQITQAGLTGTTGFVPATAGTGDKFLPGANVVVEVNNGSGVSTTVTFDSKVPSNYGTDTDVGGVVAAGARAEFGPFPPERFAGADGLADVVCAPATTITLRAKRV